MRHLHSYGQHPTHADMVACTVCGFTMMKDQDLARLVTSSSYMGFTATQREQLKGLLQAES